MIHIMSSSIILVHGGAGDIPAGRILGKLNGVKLAAKEGYKIISNGGTAIDAVEAAVRIMENDENFNAGYGSVLNLDGEVEMSASIMDGIQLNAGAVALVKDIANPISLARRVMEQSPHVLLGAHGANKFAKEQNIPTVTPGSLVTEYASQALEDFKTSGYVRTEIGPTNESGSTVGAVCIDIHGHLAAATSTGGMNGKMVGRIGDTPLIGSGTYADDCIYTAMLIFDSLKRISNLNSLDLAHRPCGGAGIKMNVCRILSQTASYQLHMIGSNCFSYLSTC